MECANAGTLTVEGDIESCRIGLYSVTLIRGSIRREVPALCGITDSGGPLSEEECKALLAMPVRDFTEDSSRSSHWLKRSGPPYELDTLMPVRELLERESADLFLAQAEEVERMKLCCSGQKAVLAQKLDGLEVQIKALEVEREAVIGDRLRRLALEKQATQLRRELMRSWENQFFDAMRLDLELEEQIKKFAELEMLSARIIKEFIVEMEGDHHVLYRSQ